MGKRGYNMKNLLKISVLTLFAAISAFALVAISPNLAIAHDDESHEETVAQAEEHSENEEESKKEDNTPYAYVAQPGDSYTKIARKAIQTYGWNKDTNLSLEEIVAAETFLTTEAGSPELEVNQHVSLSEDAVKAAIEKAQGLDDAAKSLWSKYVGNVDFNTDNVGESR